MTFLDELLSRYLSPEENNDIPEDTNFNIYSFIENLSCGPRLSYGQKLFKDPVSEEELSRAVEVFRANLLNVDLENNSHDLHDILLEAYLRAPVSTSPTLFNNFQDITKSYSKFFNKVDHIRLNRYV